MSKQFQKDTSTPLCLCVPIILRGNNHMPMQQKKGGTTSQFWQVIKASSLSSPTLSHMWSRSPKMNMCSAMWFTISGSQCYISTPVQTSLWRTFHLTGFTFRQQHLLLSTSLLGFLGRCWKIYLSLLAAWHCFRPGLCGTKYLFIFSECLAQRKVPRVATPAGLHC